MLEDVGPDHVKVEAKPNDQGVSFGPHGRVSIQYHVSVPAGLATSFRTENGVVRLENIDGRITVASTNGPIIGRGLSGSVDASTVNGGIEIGLTSVNGDSKIVTVNGPATVILSPEINAELEAAAVNGGVTTQDGLAVDGRAIVQISASPAVSIRAVRRISVQTTNGGVRVGVTGDFARGRGQRGRRRAEAGG